MFIKNKIEELLSKEFCCSLAELNESAAVYTVNDNVEKPYIKIMAYRNCIVVCTSENLRSKVQKLLKNKTRDEIFEFPFVYGQTIHYVPGNGWAKDTAVSSNYEYECLFDRDIASLAGLSGFENSLVFDETGFTSAKAVSIARDDGRIIGIAGAAGSSVKDVWEIGIDVTAEYRNAGIGTYLVRKLTEELLIRNIVPFYSASVTNIGSQMVAGRSGYVPFWVDTYGTILDGSSAYNDIVNNLYLQKQKL